ncbi:MAG: hypothetical protein NW206_19680 [Hyphomonadaceae bacterium]|nr:hypothetical protein [Hyphomonadaceae bacterium]
MTEPNPAQALIDAKDKHDPLVTGPAPFDGDLPEPELRRRMATLSDLNWRMLERLAEAPRAVYRGSKSAQHVRRLHQTAFAWPKGREIWVITRHGDRALQLRGAP